MYLKKLTNLHIVTRDICLRKVVPFISTRRLRIWEKTYGEKSKGSGHYLILINDDEVLIPISFRKHCLQNPHLILLHPSQDKANLRPTHFSSLKQILPVSSALLPTLP